MYFEAGEVPTGGEMLAEREIYPPAVAGESLRGGETPLIWPPPRREFEVPTSSAAVASDP